MILEKKPLHGTEPLLVQLRSFCLPWRPITIGVDGRNGAGKSSLARNIAWQLGMPVLETDFWLMREPPLYDELCALVHWRHMCGRPLILEGIELLRTLEKIGIKADFFIFITNDALECDADFVDNDDKPPAGTVTARVATYFATYRPQERADVHIRWREQTV